MYQTWMHAIITTTMRTRRDEGVANTAKMRSGEQCNHDGVKCTLPHTEDASKGCYVQQNNNDAAGYGARV